MAAAFSVSQALTSINMVWRRSWTSSIEAFFGSGRYSRFHVTPRSASRARDEIQSSRRVDWRDAFAIRAMWSSASRSRVSSSLGSICGARWCEYEYIDEISPLRMSCTLHSQRRRRLAQVERLAASVTPNAQAQPTPCRSEAEVMRRLERIVRPHGFAPRRLS